MPPELYLIWNRDWIDQLPGLPAPDTLMGAVLASAYEAAANPNRGPLPADELEAFKAQVKALHG
jgi:hypothetical protein